MAANTDPHFTSSRRADNSPLPSFSSCFASIRFSCLSSPVSRSVVRYGDRLHYQRLISCNDLGDNITNCCIVYAIPFRCRHVSPCFWCLVHVREHSYFLLHQQRSVQYKSSHPFRLLHSYSHNFLLQHNLFRILNKWSWKHLPRRFTGGPFHGIRFVSDRTFTAFFPS